MPVFDLKQASGLHIPFSAFSLFKAATNPMNYPTAAIRALREKEVKFEPRVFEYVERGGTRHSAEVLKVSEHAVIKTLVFESNEN